MNRQEKIELVESLKEAMQNSQASFFVKFKGLDVANMILLRNNLREQGGCFKVAKITLMRRAIDEISEFAELRGLLHGQIALVFSKNEPPVIAKILHVFSKEHKALQIKGGYFESRVLSVEAVKELATLPSREELLAHICVLIQAPVSNLVYAIQGVAMKLVWVLEQIQKKKFS